MSIKTLFIGFLAAFTMFACDNEINVTADFQTIPVIYALIDGNVETNYIRVEKGFIDPVIGGIDIARISDSLYFGPEVIARLTNLRTGTAVILERVDLEDEGFVREEGVFATQPNIAYKLNVADLEMEESEMLKFELIDSNDNVMTEAEALVIGDYDISGTQPTNPIRFIEDRDASFALRSDEQAAAIYDLRLFINISEEDAETGTIEDKVLEWVIETGLQRERSNNGGDFRSTTVFQVQGQEFFQFLRGSIVDTSSTVTRTFNGIDLRFDAGGQALAEYINIGNANTGITSNQVIPTFTNLTNGAVGIFSSRTTIRSPEFDQYGLNTTTLDSLREGRFTEPLNFN